jgi:hypothetical protein
LGYEIPARAKVAAGGLAKSDREGAVEGTFRFVACIGSDFGHPAGIALK